MLRDCFRLMSRERHCHGLARTRRLENAHERVAQTVERQFRDLTRGVASLARAPFVWRLGKAGVSEDPSESPLITCSRFWSRVSGKSERPASPVRLDPQESPRAALPLEL